MARKPIYITPPNRMKQKVGSGGIPEHVLERSQRYLETNPIDFGPYAVDLMKRLQKILRAGRDNKSGPEAPSLGEVVQIIMQLKSNGSMFHYQLLSMTSDVLLRFMENVKKIDDDFLDIIAVYVHVLRVVTDKKLTGNGGTEGYALTEELHRACERYNRKYGISQ